MATIDEIYNDISLIDAESDTQATKIERAVQMLRNKAASAGKLDASAAEAGQVPTADGLGSWSWDDVQGGGGTMEATFTVDEAVDTFFAPFDTSNYSHFLITVGVVGSTPLQVKCVSGGKTCNYAVTGVSDSEAYIECFLFKSSVSYVTKQFITLSMRSNNTSAATTGGNPIRYETTFSDGFIFSALNEGTTIIIKGLS